MPQFISYRVINGFLFIMSLIAMGFALLFLQGHLNLLPCPLCVLQRIGVMLMGAFALLALIISPKGLWPRLLLWLGSFAGVLWSAVVAARHVYIQHLPPDQVPSCGPGLDYWMETLPLQQVLKEVFSGSGECATIDWTFIGLSIPEQALILFSGLLLVHGVLLWWIVAKR